jgi:adenine C2-methylase RlmN of 23S rRNA A2503 and tRNA A37
MLLCMTDVDAHAASAREECNETASDDVASTSGRSHVAGHQRATLCVSSQVGCIMGCTFCATGTMGIKGDLTTGEILEQLVHAQRVTPIRNVVFMVSF